MFTRRAAFTCAAVAITIYGGLLRLDVVSARYGPFDGPAWLRALERHVVPIVRNSRPILPWAHVANPYVGGDPINYLALGREMRNFYAANVREPVFPALTRVWLWALGDRDVAVSFASAAASTLAIYLTWLLGAAVASRPVGLLAALALAIETVVIDWSSEGWRDDTFMLFVTLAAWRLVRLRQQPTTANAVWAGAASAGACLTRITALSFVVPALLWIAQGSSGDRRSRVRAVTAAAAVTIALVAPYLVACAIEFRDPLYAVNYHTRYYRAAEGLTPEPSVGAFDYVSRKLFDRPLAGVDTFVVGMFVWPFAVKWTGFVLWLPALAWILPWFAAAGLLLFCWTPDGRLLLLVLFTSLVPYCVTWSVGGGGEWRFTAHVYPIFLVAAAHAIVFAASWARRLLRREARWTADMSWRVVAYATMILAVVLGWTALQALPYFVAREALAAGAAVTLYAGGRDRMYFQGPWSSPGGGGNVVVRAAKAGVVGMRIPLPVVTDYDLTLRVDPAGVPAPDVEPEVRVFLNRRLLTHLTLASNPERVGSYRVVIPRALAGRTFNSLDFVASRMVPAGSAGPQFSWLSPTTPVAFRLWYLRLEPRRSPGSASILK